MDGLNLTCEQLAERWGIPTGTLAYWRCAGKGPRYLKIGKHVRYPIQEVKDFEQAQLHAAVHVSAVEQP